VISVKKFLCPECRKFVDEFYEGFDEYSEWVVRPKEDGNGAEHVECIDQQTIQFVRSFCNCGFETVEWIASSFIVEVDEAKKTVTPVGGYWKEHYDEFAEIVKELGYTPIGG